MQKEDIIDGTSLFLLSATLPVAESFGFAQGSLTTLYSTLFYFFLFHVILVLFSFLVFLFILVLSCYPSLLFSILMSHFSSLSFSVSLIDPLSYSSLFRPFPSPSLPHIFTLPSPTPPILISCIASYQILFFCVLSYSNIFVIFIVSFYIISSIRSPLLFFLFSSFPPLLLHIYSFFFSLFLLTFTLPSSLFPPSLPHPSLSTLFSPPSHSPFHLYLLPPPSHSLLSPPLSPPPSELLKRTSGNGTAPQLQFSHWQTQHENPFWRPTTLEELEVKIMVLN